MLKAILIAASLFPSPESPRSKAAFNQMVTDYAQCSAYWDFAASYFGLNSPRESTIALGGMANADMEGNRLEVLAGLYTDTYENRRAASRAEMLKTLDKQGFSGLYSAYDGFCTALKEDPGKAFLRRLPPRIPERRPMKG